MKPILSALFLAVALVATTAKAGELNVDLTGPHCTVTQTNTSGDKTTASSCSTADQLPAVRYDSKDLSLFATPNLAGGSVGAALNVCPGLALGLQGSATSANAGGSETHAYGYGAFALVKMHGDGLSLESTLSVAQAEANGVSTPTATGLSNKLLLDVAKEWAPFLGVDGSYSDLGNGTNTWTGSASLGVRAKL